MGRRAVLHPDRRFLGRPIEAHFGPLRQFTLANSHHPNHSVGTQRMETEG